MERSLDELQAEFLARGGEVKTFAPTERAKPAVLHTSPKGAVKKHKQKPLTVSNPATMAEDARLVELIKRHKDSAPGSSALAATVGISASRLQRLLTKYFAADPTVTPLLAMTRAARLKRDDALILEKVRNLLAKGVEGLYSLSAGTGASTVRISRIAKEAGIKIPRPAAKAYVPIDTVPVPIDTLKRWALEGNQSTHTAIMQWLEDMNETAG